MPNTPLVQLKSMLSSVYKTEDEDVYKIKLLEGLSDAELQAFKEKLPNQYLSIEIENLLRFSKGFEFDVFEFITFDALNKFGFNNLFPQSIELMGDGLGNYWILDLDKKGNWGMVYYVCHDPAVIIKHSDNLTQFLEHLDEFGKKGILSHLDNIHEKIVFDIWSSNKGLIEQSVYNDTFSTEFKASLPESYVVADLTNKPLKSGFSLGRNTVIDSVIRLDNKPIWIIEKNEKRSIWSRLFG